MGLNFNIGGDVGSFLTHAVSNIGAFFGDGHKGAWGDTGLPHWIDEGVGELTGRNSSRRALNMANDQYNAAQEQANQLIEQQKWDRMNSDLQASQNAAAITASAHARDGVSFQGNTPTSLGAAGKDFLGL